MIGLQKLLIVLGITLIALGIILAVLYGRYIDGAVLTALGSACGFSCSIIGHRIQKKTKNKLDELLDQLETK